MNWSNVALSTLVDIKGGGTPSKANPEYWNGSIPWASVKDFKSSDLNGASDYITQEGIDNSATSLIPSGNLIVPTRMALGKVAINSVDIAINQDLKALIIKDESVVDTEYLFRCIQSKSEEIVRQGKGATVKGITVDVLKNLQIPLPPLETQKQIAAVLEKADQLRTDCQKMEQELNNLAQSVFIDMFGDPVTNPKGWDKKELLSLCSKVTDGTHQSPEWAETGVPFLFISNVRNGKVDFDTGKYITRRCYEELTRTSPIEVDDILYTTVGSYGHVALVKDNFPDFCFQRHIAHIKPDSNKVIPAFLFYQLQTSGVKHLADLAVKGIAQKTLNLKDLKKFEMIVPPEDKQLELINYMNHQYQALNELEQMKSEYEMLFNSLMQKAFKGELNL